MEHNRNRAAFLGRQVRSYLRIALDLVVSVALGVLVSLFLSDHQSLFMGGHQVHASTWLDLLPLRVADGWVGVIVTFALARLGIANFKDRQYIETLFVPDFVIDDNTGRPTRRVKIIH